MGPRHASVVISIMEYPVTFAAHFARLVRLVEERADVVAQKAALRNCIAASRRGGVDLSVQGDVLLAGGIVVRRDEDTDLLVARIASRGIATVVVEDGAAPGDMLTAARWLAESAGDDPSNGATLSGLRTVHVTPATESPVEETPLSPPPTAETGTPAETTPTRRRSGLTLPLESRPTARRKSGTVSATDAPPRRRTGGVPAISDRTASGRSGSFPSFEGGRRKSGTVAAIDFDPLPRTRATELIEMLDRAGGSPEVQRIVDDLIAAAEQAAREDDLETLADAAIGLFARQGESRGDELPRICAAALRRMLTPTFLRMLPRAAARSRPRADAIHAVLHQAGEDGAAAVIAQVTLARTLADRRLCFELLLKLPAAIPVLSRLLTAPQWHVARNAADLLGELHAAEAEGALSAALQHADERVRRAAAHALAKLGTQPAVQSLRGALVDPSARVRVQVASGLSSRKGLKSASTLTRALDDESDVEVQLAILAALGRVGTPDAVNRLVKAAEPDGRLFKKKPVAFRVAAVHALGEVRTSAARTVLQSLANDKEREVREAVLRVVMQSPRGDHSDTS
jgi:HEAT repeat protein